MPCWRCCTVAADGAAPPLLLDLLAEADREALPATSRDDIGCEGLCQRACEANTPGCPVDLVAAPLDIEDAPLHGGDALLHVGDALLHVGDALLHVGDAPLHGGDAPLHGEDAPLQLVRVPGHRRS